MNRRDIELLISARETTGRSFSAVVDNIEKLNRKIDEQVAQAEKGEISLRELRQSQEELAQAGRDLSSLQGQVDAYRRLAEQQAKNSVAAEQALQDFTKMKNELAALEAPTKAQERALAALERKQRTTATALNQTTVSLQKQTEVMERAGIDLAKLDQVQSQIIGSARSAGQGFVQLGVAIDSHGDNVRRAREEEQQFAAQNAFASKLAQARQLGDATRFVQLFTQAVGTVKQTDNQLAALDGFRTVGQMAVEASNDLSRFVQVGQTMPAATSQIAAGLRAIVDPGTEALRTLAGVEAAIETAGAAATAEKATVAEYSNALNDLSAASAALVRQGGLIDAFRLQAAATDTARQKVAEAQAEVQRLGAAMAAADKPTEELARDLQIAETRLGEVTRALVVEETKLGEMSRAMRQAGIDTNDLAAAQARLEAAATTASVAMGRVNQTLGRGGQRASGLFGLNPYELNNLAFQINDIFVSLASGQNPLTVLAQQGAQISQIFPGSASAIAKFALRFAPLIAVVTVAIGVLATLITKAIELNKLEKALRNVVGGDAYDTKGLQEISERLDDVGVSAEDARKLLVAFAEEGIDPERLKDYSLAAAELAERLEIDVAEAAKLMTEVMIGNFDAVLDLTEKTHDLTDADLDHAKALFEAGKAAEARQFVLDKVADRNNEIAKASEHSWTPAVRNLQSAWNSFVSFIGAILAPALLSIQRLMAELITTVTLFTGLLSGKGFVESLREAALARNTALGRTPKPSAPGASPQSIRDRRFKKDLEDEFEIEEKLTDQQRIRKAEQKARNMAQAAGVSKALEDLAVAKARTAEEHKLAKEKERQNKKDAAAGRRAGAAAKRAQREAETAQRKVDSARRELANELRQLESATGRGDSATLEQRLDIVDNKYQKIFDTLTKLRNLGLTTAADGRTLEAVEAEVNASKERLKNEERIKFFEDQINLLTEQRNEEIETITDAQVRGAKTVVQTYEAAEEVNKRISPQIIQAAKNALEIARNIAGTQPSPEMVSMIARLERLIAGEPTSDVVNTVGTEALERQEAKLNKLLQERSDLVSNINTLNELGVISDVEARQKVAQAYVGQAAAIKPVIDSLAQTVEFLHQQRDALTGLPLISDAAYQVWLTRIQTVNQELKYTDARIKAIQDTAQQAIAEGLVDMFHAAASGIAGLITGTKSFGDAIGGIFRAAIGAVAKFTQAVAEAIIQILALEVAKKIVTSFASGGLFHEGGVVGSTAGGRRVRSNVGSFAGAPRFHGGLGAGLKRNEYKAVLMKGEEVLTDDDPRHISNIGRGGGGGSRETSIKQVLLLDPDAVPSAMQRTSGQRAILTVIRENAPTIKQMLR